VLSTVRDMSCYKKTEAALKQSEVNYKNLIYAMNDAVWVVDHEGNFVDFNDAFVNALGYSREQLLSLGIGSIDNSLNHQQSKEILAKLVRYGHHVFEAIHTAKDGQQIPVEISSSFTTYNGKPVVLNIARNVSERMKAEERLSQIFCQLSLVNEKLGVVGGLTRHDVRNKLSAINSYAYLLKKKHKDQPDIVEGLSKIESAVADSVKIFEFAKMYEQLGVEQLTYIDVGKALDEAVALFSGLTINVVNDCLGRIVLADSFLRQMFYNFVDNTRKYGQKATTVHVYSEQEKSGGLRLIYKDDGVGISLENKKKLFFESFSTGGSTGFGLFFIKKMLDVYGWTITEEGSPGKGAKFIISLPVKR